MINKRNYLFLSPLVATPLLLAANLGYAACSAKIDTYIGTATEAAILQCDDGIDNITVSQELVEGIKLWKHNPIGGLETEYDWDSTQSGTQVGDSPIMAIDSGEGSDFVTVIPPYESTGGNVYLSGFNTDHVVIDATLAPGPVSGGYRFDEVALRVGMAFYINFSPPILGGGGAPALVELKTGQYESSVSVSFGKAWPSTWPSINLAFAAGAQNAISMENEWIPSGASVEYSSTGVKIIGLGNTPISQVTWQADHVTYAHIDLHGGHHIHMLGSAPNSANIFSFVNGINVVQVDGAGLGAGSINTFNGGTGTDIYYISPVNADVTSIKINASLPILGWGGGDSLHYPGGTFTLTNVNGTSGTLQPDDVMAHSIDYTSIEEVDDALFSVGFDEVDGN